MRSRRRNRPPDRQSLTREPVVTRPESHPSTPPEEFFFENERVPAPEAQELDSEAAWEEFERLYTQEVQDSVRPTPAAAPATSPQAETQPGGFQPTQPMFAPGSPAPVADPPALAPLPLTAQDVMVEARRFNRVCPKPQAWQRLYELIPGKIVHGPSHQPSPPLLGDAWHATSAMPKRMCLRDQIEWAEHHGALEAVMQFIKSLPEDEWHHVDD